ncbi:hypothetical protein BDK51DRAFT_29449 [Blyttiomyces helicus]|uniref:J domain-containing protein n=1 Tax=Blyttiomyces helicus TaxID=388810 RepID=A0A4V1IS56_9FUNG|nr:hypothetical protein BDK51DRAFT_29449 [Blyttiomyces helicus]|eukprot:RKO92387.1 hypothetical protein BDK51DRAFT_29449 [Blyttiomyces helicus]
MARMGINVEVDQTPPVYRFEETNTLANDNTHLEDEKIFDFVRSPLLKASLRINTAPHSTFAARTSSLSPFLEFVGTVHPSRASKTDPYKIFEMDRRLSFQEYQKRYRDLSLVHHPDRPGVNKVDFCKLNNVWLAIQNDIPNLTSAPNSPVASPASATPPAPAPAARALQLLPLPHPVTLRGLPPVFVEGVNSFPRVISMTEKRRLNKGWLWRSQERLIITPSSFINNRITTRKDIGEEKAVFRAICNQQANCFLVVGKLCQTRKSFFCADSQMNGERLVEKAIKLSCATILPENIKVDFE